MAMVGVVSGSLYKRGHSLSCLAWSWVGGRLAPFYIHQMNRVNSRKQWLCHDDSTINIVFVIMIMIIMPAKMEKQQRPIKQNNVHTYRQNHIITFQDSTFLRQKLTKPAL